MQSDLVCINAACRQRYGIDEVLYNCPKCGGLLEARYQFGRPDVGELKLTWRERRMSNGALDQSGVWRYRELFPFVDDDRHIVTLREGNTPLLNGPRAADYGGLDQITFKHQGFNPTGSFKDNGMTAGVAQARRLGMKRVACVSTGNTSASMAAYASAGGLEPLIFIPTATSHTASSRRRSSTARRPFRSKPTSTRFWRSCASLPSVSESICSIRSTRSASKGKRPSHSSFCNSAIGRYRTMWLCPEGI